MHFMYETYTEARSSIAPHIPDLLRQIQWELKLAGGTDVDDQKILKLIKDVEDAGPLDYSELVLCNLSKGEYIRDRHVMDLEKHLASGSECDITLAQALLSKFCWSSDDTGGAVVMDNDRLIRGPWAEDRFEITTIDRMNSKHGVD